MSTVIPNLYKINGVIDTNTNVLENMNLIAEAARSWLTFDVHQGKWAVVINTTGTSVASFTNSNIIGGINITSTSLTEVYNSVEMEFPHIDLVGEPDYVKVSIDAGDRYPNEPDNVLSIKSSLINNPIQAQVIAGVMLKQSRIDKAVEFTVDYSYIGLKAGQLIDITNSDLSWSSKVFRIINIAESDEDDGTILIKITALEYDSSIYSTSGLTYETRERNSAIPTRNNNTNIQAKDDENISAQVGRLLAATVTTGLLNMVLRRNPVTKAIEGILSPANSQRESDILSVFDNGDKAKALKGLKLPSVVIAGNNQVCEGSTVNLTLSLDCSSCLFDTMSYNYTITGIQSDDISIPLTGTVSVPGTLAIPTVANSPSESESMTITIGSSSKTISILDQLSFTYSTSASLTSITEGESSTVTLTTTGVADGTTIPYAITGTGTGRVSTALTGSVTVSSNSASLSVVTTDDGVYTGTQSITVTFDQSQTDPCNQLDKTATIEILDNDTAPPTPPADTTCETISIPLIWCPTYDGTDNQVKSLAAASYITVQAPISGGPTVSVPKQVSVIKGNPSIVTITETVLIDASSNKAGQDFNIITNFDNIVPNGIVTGTTTTVRGY